MKATKNLQSGRLLGFIMIGIAICAFTPIIKHPIFLITLGFMALVQVLHYSNASGYRRNPRLVMCVYLYIFVCIIYRVLGVSDVSIGIYTKHFCFFIPILLMLLIKDKLTDSQCRLIYWLIVLVVLVNIIDNIRLCLLHPELLLMVNRDMNTAEMGVSFNIGGSPFYNGIFFFILVSFFCLINCNYKKIKYLMLGCVLISGVYIFAFCLKASIIVFTIISIVLLFFAKRAKSIRKFLVMIVAPTLVVYVFVSLYEDFIIKLILDTVSSDRLAQRLVLLIDSDSADAAKGAATVNARGNLWMLSINTWLDNPVNFIFGIGDHRADWMAGETALKTGLGQHSDFFDSLGRYGLIGLVLLTAILKLSLTYMMSFFDKTYKLQLFIIIMIFMLFGFTKGVFKPDIACSLFLLLPMSAMYVNPPNN